jgi:hypothetical protein
MAKTSYTHPKENTESTKPFLDGVITHLLFLDVTVGDYMITLC